MLKYNLKQIVEHINAEVVENKNISLEDVEILGVNTLENSSADEISFLGFKKYFNILKETESRVIITESKFKKDIENIEDKIFLITDNAYFAFCQVISLFEEKIETIGISTDSYISENAVLGEDLYVEEFVRVGSNSKIGSGTKILSGTKIAHNVKIGKNCLIYQNVVIRKDSVIGDNVIIQAGAVIGGDGFGFVPYKGQIHKIPHIGKVIIEDNVEIGCNVTIDKGVVGPTIIGKNTKVDNLAHIAHNVEIGENCFIVAQVGISGSVKIGNNVRVAGQAGIVGHLSIEDNVTVAARSLVMNNISANTFVSGFPAINHKDDMRIKASMRKLPAFLRKVKKELNLDD